VTRLPDHLLYRVCNEDPSGGEAERGAWGMDLAPHSLQGATVCALLLFDGIELFLQTC